MATESLVRSEYATMTVALKIWRFDASTGERELRDYEVDEHLEPDYELVKPKRCDDECVSDIVELFAERD